MSLFNPKPCSPKEGMARMFLTFFGYGRASFQHTKFQLNSNHVIPEERKNQLRELELNPGPLALQTTTLTPTAIPWAKRLPNHPVHF